jgi:hypothetical protein
MRLKINSAREAHVTQGFDREQGNTEFLVLIDVIHPRVNCA